jgi:hypothetical protein
MILILSKSHSESKIVAEDMALTAGEWRHVTDPQSMRGFKRGTLVYRHAGAFERHDIGRIELEADLLGYDVHDV